MVETLKVKTTINVCNMTWQSNSFYHVLHMILPAISFQHVVNYFTFLKATYMGFECRYSSERKK